MVSQVNCPKCSSESLYVKSPDYGFGDGANLGCKDCGCSFMSAAPGADLMSAKSRAASRANAEAYRRVKP